MCTFAGKGAAEGMEDSSEALYPQVGERPQKWSGNTGTRLVSCPCRVQMEAGRRLCETVWEGIMKLEVFVIFNFLKQRAPSRRKTQLKMSLMCSQEESTIKDIYLCQLLWLHLLNWQVMCHNCICPLSMLTFTMHSRYKSILEHEPFLLKCRVLVGLIQRGTIFIFSTYIHLVLSPWV